MYMYSAAAAGGDSGGGVGVYVHIVRNSIVQELQHAAKKWKKLFELFTTNIVDKPGVPEDDVDDDEDLMGLLMHVHISLSLLPGSVFAIGTVVVNHGRLLCKLFLAACIQCEIQDGMPHLTSYCLPSRLG